MKEKQLVTIYCIFCLGSTVCYGQASSVVQHVYHQSACVWETFTANCGSNRVMLIVEAVYGRMRNYSRCLSLRSGELPCSADVKLFAEKQCSGRRQCSFKLTNDELKNVTGTCSKYDEKFLDFAYRCENVYSADSETCVANTSLIVKSSIGYLANVITEETGKGSSICPWRFEPEQGQTVHLTLLDFGMRRMDNGERETNAICRIYATIRHLGSTSPGSPETLICAGDKRERHVIATTTNLEILINRQNIASADNVYFLIKFQKFSCPEILAPPGAAIEKSGSEIRVYCYDDRKIYLEMRCEAGQWTPQLNLTCTTAMTISPFSKSGSLSSSSSPCSFEYIRSKDISSVESITDFHLRVFCLNGNKFDVFCDDGKWISSLNKTCSIDESHLFHLERYLVPGGLLLLTVVVIIIAVIMCRSRHRDKTDKMNNLVPESLVKNTYCAAQLQESGAPCRPMSDIYDVLDENGIQANGNITQLPECSSSSTVCAAPGSCKTLPRIDPCAGCSVKSRSDTFPMKRQLPEPHEYTIPLPRDSTYLVPKEELGDHHHYDTVPSIEKQDKSNSE